MTMAEIDYEEWDRDETRREFCDKRKRARYSCSDGFCGAEDCETCHPGCTERNEEEDDE
jgi:hypothetical protein